MTETSLATMIRDLRQILSARYNIELAGGQLHVRIQPLPGSLVAAGVQTDDSLWLFMDIQKPDAVGHARQMLKTHPELIVTDGEQGTFVVSAGALDPHPGDVCRLVLGLSEAAPDSANQAVNLALEGTSGERVS